MDDVFYAKEEIKEENFSKQIQILQIIEFLAYKKERGERRGRERERRERNRDKEKERVKEGVY
jgi:hypothetical protein